MSLTEALVWYEQYELVASHQLTTLADAARRWAEVEAKRRPVWIGSALSQTWHVTDDPSEADGWLIPGDWPGERLER